MKKEILKTTVSLILAVVAVCGFSVYAHAMSGEIGGSTLLFTYYDVRSIANGGLGLTDNYFTVTNTASDRWVQAHVRVRTGKHSIELLDFDVLLSPTDVFAFDLFEDRGVTVFASCDSKTLTDSGFPLNFDRNGDGVNDCFVLDTTTFPAMLSLIQTCDGVNAVDALADTKKGYVEVIGEGAILADNFFATGGDKSKCPGPDGQTGGSASTDDVSVSGKMIDHTLDAQRLCTTPDGPGKCPGSCVDMFQELIGRVYYGTVAGISGTAPTASRVAQLNAEIVEEDNDLIFHKESYNAEKIADKCVGTDGAGSNACFAYVAATTTSPVVEGADDMNFCLWQDSIVSSGAITGVRNKFGAGATFGPTLADSNSDLLRDGSLATLTTILNGLSADMSLGYVSDEAAASGNATKDFANSHYFSLPAPNPLDVVTGFAFIFPFQHFIAEKNGISVVGIFDNEENTTSVPLTKFISPGLPTVSTPGDEAALFKLTSPFAEGWISFRVSATNATKTTSCDPGVACINSTGTNTLVRTGSTLYLPGYTAAVFNIGGQVISASHFQYGTLSD